MSNRLLASVNIFVESTEMDSVIDALHEVQNVEEVYEVAGEYDIVTLVCASTLEEFREILQRQIMKIKGVKSTITTIVLRPHKGPRCQQKSSIISTA